MTDRTNREWLDALSDDGQEEAMSALRAVLRRGLRFALAQRHGVTEADIEDFVQDAQVKILSSLASFRGESRFTTWAQKIAVHVGLSELRRRRWRDLSLEEMTGNGDYVPDILSDQESGPEQLAIQQELLALVRLVIAEELTERQRQALLATQVRGVPLALVAEKMGTTRNALYKLLHDARAKLKQRILARGLTAEELLEAFGT
jgi:RNA polymerase sigma-70 factor (ECF subfamily)